MKLLIDTCVLFPTVMRHALLGACKIQGWTPLWRPPLDFAGPE